MSQDDKTEKAKDWPRFTVFNGKMFSIDGWHDHPIHGRVQFVAFANDQYGGAAAPYGGFRTPEARLMVLMYEDFTRPPTCGAVCFNGVPRVTCEGRSGHEGDHRFKDDQISVVWR